MAESRSYLDPERTSLSVENAIQNSRQQKQSNKRKRDVLDHTGNRSQLGPQPITLSNAMHENGHDSSDLRNNLFSNDASANDFSSLSQQLTHHITNQNAMHGSTASALAASMPQLTVPQPTELSFQGAASGNDEDRQLDNSFDMGPDGHQNHHVEGVPYNLDTFSGDNAAQAQAARDGANGGNKPAVGTDEWHKLRKDNHKEVERRRRETINEGINELAKIVPGCEKNKGSILQRGVQYITQLKDNETRNIEKWTLEKLLTDQAIAELTSTVDKLKTELDRSYMETERWRKTCQNAGLEPRRGSDEN